MYFLLKRVWILVLVRIQGYLCQGLDGVLVDTVPTVRHGDMAKLTCDFTGNDSEVEYITWTKISANGVRTPVHSYVTCSAENTGYNTLYGRSMLEVNGPIGSQTSGSDPEASRDALISSYHHDSSALRYTHLSDENMAQKPGDSRAVLSILKTQVSDHGVYECTIKVRQTAPVSGKARLNVVVPPLDPVLSLNDTDILAGENVTLTCTANTGLPAGGITWSMHRLDDISFMDVPDDDVVTKATLLSNGTTVTTSSVLLQVTGGDDLAVVKCQVTSSVLKFWEDKPHETLSINVLYPPRDGKILFDATLGRYYCAAKAKPEASYVWLRLNEDADSDNSDADTADDAAEKTIMSTGRYLDLSSITGEGYFRFRCLASNIIDNIRHTKVLDTKLRVIGHTTTTPVPTRPTPLRPAINSARQIASWASAQGSPLNLLGHNAPIQPVIADDDDIASIFDPYADFDRYFYADGDANTRSGQGFVDTVAIGDPPTPTVTTPAPVARQGAADPVITPQARAARPQARANFGGGGGGGGRGGGSGGADYDIVEDSFFIRSPFAMANLLSRIMARKGEDSQITEPLHHITLANGTKVAINMSSPLYKRARNALFKKLLKVAKERRLDSPIPVPDHDTGAVSGGDQDHSLNNVRGGNNNNLSVPSGLNENSKRLLKTKNIIHRQNTKKRRPKYRRKIKVKSRQNKKKSGYHLMDMSLLKPTKPKVTSRGYDDVIGPYRRLGSFGNLIDASKDGKMAAYDGMQDQTIKTNRRMHGRFLEQPANSVTGQHGNQVEQPLSKQLTIGELSGLNQMGENTNENQQSLLEEPREYVNHNQQPRLGDHTQDMEQRDMNGFSDYSPTAYRASMGSFAKNGNDQDIVHAEPLDNFGNSVNQEVTRGQADNLVSSAHEEVTSTTWSDFDCRSQSDGSYGGGCRAFYRCVSGLTYLVNCKDQFVYNKNSGKCTDSQTAPGPCGIWRDCTKRKNGKYPDVVRKCQYYYTCQGGVFFGHNKCGEGLIFNTYGQICDWPDKVSPPCGQNEDRGGVFPG